MIAVKGLGGFCYTFSDTPPGAPEEQGQDDEDTPIPVGESQSELLTYMTTRGPLTALLVQIKKEQNSTKMKIENSYWR